MGRLKLDLVVLGAVLWGMFDDKKLIWGVAAFANQLGSLVASRHGGIPPWTLEEVTALET